MKGFKAWIIKLVFKKLADMDTDHNGVITMKIEYDLISKKLSEPSFK